MFDSGDRAADLDEAFELVEPEPVPRPSDCDPSGWLALEMDTCAADPGRLDDAQLIDAVVAFDRLSSWALARQARLLAEFARRRPGDDPHAVMCDRPSVGSEYAPDEVGLALRLSRGSATARLHQSARLVRELPETLAAWERGVIDAGKVRAVLDCTAAVDAGLAREVQDRVLARAGDQTQAQLRAALNRAVLAADPVGAAARHEQARTERRVAVCPEGEGMAALWSLLPAPDAVACYQRLTGLARGLGVTDSRSMDARRADLLVDLITGRTRAGAAGQAQVQVTVPLGTLLGASEYPGELTGYGPIPAPMAREIAADGVWRRLVIDPMSGVVLDHGRRTYRPPAALRDFVRARDRYCRFPTCRQPAAAADLDHAVPYLKGGTTSPTNLYAACRHHHRLKTRAGGWRVAQDLDGRVTWTTPTRHSGASEPHNYRPAGEDPVIAPRPKPPAPTGPDPPPPF